MYTDKENINLLTALLRAEAVADIVACPGARNAPIVHDFYEAGLNLHPVTDERSAAFVALGIIEATGRPVAVCVTSGSALLGTLPAVAEAAARALPLLVISADRPADRIGQLEGQTLPQRGALHPYAPTYDIPEPVDETMRRYARRQLCEALFLLKTTSGPVHLNLPLSEPLFSFTVYKLPTVFPLEKWGGENMGILPDPLVRRIRNARFPIIVVGQLDLPDTMLRGIARVLDDSSAMLLLPDVLSGLDGAWRTALLEDNEALRDTLRPDLILHLGGNTVHKRLRLSLRSVGKKEVVRIGKGTDLLADTYDGLVAVIDLDPIIALQALGLIRSENTVVKTWRDNLDAGLNEQRWPDQEPMDHYVTRRFIEHAENFAATLPGKERLPLQAANSSAVRNVARYLRSERVRVRCNRGVNGIEGSLSTAVGFTIATDGLVPVVIGDLSFFYDQNALWNTRLRPNLRILLINNGGGRIFNRLPGLEPSPAFTDYVFAAHHVEAAEIAKAYGLAYRAVQDKAELDDALQFFFDPHHRQPVLLEVIDKERKEHDLKDK